jgi:hypothetical protein
MQGSSGERVNVGLDDSTGCVAIIAGRFALSDDIERGCLGTMLGDVCFHRPNIIWRDHATAAIGIDFGLSFLKKYRRSFLSEGKREVSLVPLR